MRLLADHWGAGFLPGADSVPVLDNLVAKLPYTRATATCAATYLFGGRLLHVWLLSPRDRFCSRLRDRPGHEVAPLQPAARDQPRNVSCVL